MIVADHGEGIGEHHFMGHSFVAYQELAHVPLLIKFPETQGSEQRLSTTVSTRRLFHTILEAARVEVFETNYRPATDVRVLSLKQTLSGQDPEEGLVFVEAYPPTTILSIMSKHAPHFLDQFHCRLNRWAVYQGDHKLVKIEGVQDELFNLAADPAETRNIIDQSSETAADLSGKLKAFIPEAIARRPHNWQANQSIDLENDENIIKQLQALGYIE
jgi:arylsulfatase A-like enzyme